MNRTITSSHVKNLADAAATQDCLARLLPVPGVIMLGHADVCRPELLFEIELDAAVVGPIPGPAATTRTRSKETTWASTPTAAAAARRSK